MSDLTCAMEEGCLSASANNSAAAGNTGNSLRKLLRKLGSIQLRKNRIYEYFVHFCIFIPSKSYAFFLTFLVNIFLYIHDRGKNQIRFTQKISNIGDGDFISSTHPNEWEYHTCHK